MSNATISRAFLERTDLTVDLCDEYGRVVDWPGFTPVPPSMWLDDKYECES